MDTSVAADGSTHTPRHASTFDVVIIGAGVAGLETARLLSSRSGLSVAVVEARSRVGGRVWS